MKTNQTEHKINNKERNRKRVVRIFALLLALLLVSGTFYTLIAFIAEWMA
jgi:energy-converting hydrogenase Eha subunit F